MQFWSLSGLTDYERVSRLQKRLVELRAQNQIEDTILFLEHLPVVTRGRGLQFTGELRARHMPVPPMPAGIQFAESERGGDLTYHGPGQLVIYPICRLDGKGLFPHHDVTGFLRKMESWLVGWLRTLKLAHLDLIADTGSAATGKASAPLIDISARDSATGVWVGERKIASIGVAVRKWVTYHGIAINIVNDLQPFHLISPCGFSPEVMTRLRDLAPRDPRWTHEDWRGTLESELSQVLVPGARVVKLELSGLEREIFTSGERPVNFVDIESCI